jgi:DNA-binding MarR family transcriptional regulator
MQVKSDGGCTSGHPPTQVVKAEDVEWLLTHLRSVVAASPPAVWAGRGMTLLQLATIHLISALAPVSLTDLAQALGTRPPATSAMVDRLAHAGMVCRTPDPDNGRRVELTLTTAATKIIGDTGADTAKRLHAVLTGLSPQIRRHLIDVLRDSVPPSTA